MFVCIWVAVSIEILPSGGEILTDMSVALALAFLVHAELNFGWVIQTKFVLFL